MQRILSLLGLSILGTATVLFGSSAPAAPAPLKTASAAPMREEAIGLPPPLAPGAVDLGPLQAMAPLTIRIVLKPRDPGRLASFVAAVATPSSASYRDYLAPGEFGAKFGQPTAVLDAVLGTLRALGLRPGRPTPDRLVIPLSTTAHRAERAFGLGISRYRLASGRIVFANSSPPKLPASIAGAVEAVIGLDDLMRERPGGWGERASGGWGERAPGGSGGRAPASSSPLSVRSAGHGPAACSSALSVGAATAGDLASAYGLKGLYSDGDLGQGESVALFETAAFSASDVSTYQACYGTKASVKTVAVDGGGSIGSGTLEATADIEDVIGLAPDARILVYEAPNVLEPDYIDNWTRIVDDDTAQVVSTSWLSCEASDPRGYLTAENTLLEQAAAQGQTVLAAAGDWGSEGCDTLTGATTLEVGDTASQPYATGVGGTEWPGSTRTGETTWNGQHGSGGGGISWVWPMPSWQQGPGVINSYSSGAPCAATAGYCRQVPDVSALAGHPHYTFYCTAGDCSSIGGWGYFWGTSFAAPLWASAVALSDEYCAGAPPAGFLDPALYELASSSPPPFNDITTGNNDFTGTNAGDYPATVGYDLATGLGTPVFATGSSVPGLTAYLCEMATPTPTTTRITSVTKKAAVGELISFAVEVAAPVTQAGAATPSGSVQIGGKEGKCTGKLSGSGGIARASCRIRASTPRKAFFLAGYSGDSRFRPSRTPSPTTVEVAKATSKTALRLSMSKVTYGREHSVVLEVTVTPEFAGAPAGSVVVSSGRTVLCRITALVKDKGHCSPRATALPAGSFAIRASYAGNADFDSSRSSAAKLTVVKARARSGPRSLSRPGPTGGSLRLRRR